ncbi:hypothetical protein J7M07_04265 [bacterium]|nr:hypothetical protein [bacterium]
MEVAFWIALMFYVGLWIYDVKYAIERAPVIEGILGSLVLIFLATPFAIIGFQRIFNLPVFTYYEALYTGFWIIIAIRMIILVTILRDRRR